MKLLLLGARGQVGGQLRRRLAALGEVIALTRDSADLCGDLLNLQGLADTVRAIRPDAVVNAAAYTAVDRAQDDEAAAFAVNATACDLLARETSKLGAWLVHYSSDYVYGGKGDQPWAEGDTPAPLNVYGRSKLAGDQAVAAGNPRHLVLRTSWVHDPRGHNFLTSILGAAAIKDTLHVVDDQWGSPTPAALVAVITAQLLPRLADGQAGLYHLAAQGFTTWHAYAELAVRQGLEQGLGLRAAPERVVPIPSSSSPRRAPRPANARLDTSRLRNTFGLQLPPWQQGVRAAIADLAAAPPGV